MTVSIVNDLYYLQISAKSIQVNKNYVLLNIIKHSATYVRQTKGKAAYLWSQQFREVAIYYMLSTVYPYFNFKDYNILLLCLLSQKSSALVFVHFK